VVAGDSDCTPQQRCRGHTPAIHVGNNAHRSQGAGLNRTPPAVFGGR